MLLNYRAKVTEGSVVCLSLHRPSLDRKEDILSFLMQYILVANLQFFDIHLTCLLWKGINVTNKNI